MSGHAIVTGGNRGIGWDVTRRLLARGFTVDVLSRSAPIEPRPGLTHYAIDLSDDGALRDLATSLKTPCVLVNNAGVMHSPGWKDYPADLEAHTLAVNLVAPMRLMQLLGAKMADAGGGRIINVGSIAGQLGHPDVWYGATKAALINATKSYAKLLGPAGVCVNLIAPGPVETDMLSSIPADRLATIKARLLTGRFLTADEVGATIEWLCVDSPPTLNGATINLNDGAH